MAKNPVLKELVGDDIITADGTTLLGSDDKAGIAEIMTMIDILKQNPEIKHGTIAIAFTPDEEVGTGIEKFDVKGFGAKFAGEGSPVAGQILGCAVIESTSLPPKSYAPTVSRSLVISYGSDDSTSASVLPA